jgi:flavodoxin
VRRLAIVLLPLLPLVGCGDDGSSTEAFCEQAEAFDERFEEIEAELESSEVPTAGVFADGADAIEELAEGAPDEVADDLQTIVDGFDEIAAALEEVDLTDPAGTGVVDAAARMQTVAEDIEAAVRRVEAFLETECEISLQE